MDLVSNTNILIKKNIFTKKKYLLVVIVIRIKYSFMYTIYSLVYLNVSDLY